jgi:hypothetical protein
MTARPAASALAFALAASQAAAQEPPGCAPVAPIPLVSPQVLGNGSPGSVTTAQIQAALDVGGHVRFNVGTAPATIDLTAPLTVTRAAVLDGGGNVTLSGRGLNRVLRVQRAVTAAQTYVFGLQNITIAEGATPSEPGAGLFVPSSGDWQAVDLRIVNVTFRDNDAIQVHQDWGGGGLYAIGARDVLVAGSVFERNTGSNGGALYSLGSRSVTIVDSRFQDNTATGTGGNPGSGGNAGAIGVDGAQRTVTICRTRILENHSNAYGTGFFSVGYDALSPTTFYRVTFARNVQTSASQFAAGAYVQGVPFTIRQSSFLFNEANGYAGLFLGPGATGTIENSTFYGNLARQALGGALSVGTTAAVTIVNSTIAANRAPGAAAFLGGVVVGATNALTLRNVILAQNTGGNVWNPWNISRPVAGSHVAEHVRYRPVSGQEEPAAVATGLQWGDPLAAAPAWNGGGTPTAAIEPGSLAQDAGTASGAPAVDQRGVPRDGAPDLGAFEIGNDLIFADGFESGDLSAWSSAQDDAGDLTAGPGAIGPPSPGLRAVVDDTAGVYVVDETPDDESRYRARFYFDPSGFDPGEAQAHLRTRLFLAFEEGPARRLVAIVLRRIGGAYSLMGRARLDDGSQASTPFVPITDGPHFVEVDWRRASTPDANDGSFQMWIDGTSVATLSNLDNRLSGVDFVRLGALSVKPGAAGVLHWDEFESRRQSYIGP